MDFPDTKSPPRDLSPLYSALRSPALPAAFMAAARADDESSYRTFQGSPSSAPSVVRLLVTGPTAEVKRGLKQLRAKVKADRSYQQDSHYSRLAGHHLHARVLENLGTPKQASAHDDLEPPNTKPEADDTAYLESFHLSLLLTPEGEALGYCSFGLKWRVAAAPETLDDTELEIEIYEVWLDPVYRGKSLSSVLVQGVTGAAVSNLRTLEHLVDWSQRERLEIKVTVVGEVYSTSGEKFLENCAQDFLQENKFLIEEAYDPLRLFPASIEVDAWW